MLDEFQNRYGAEWPIAGETSFIEKFDALMVPMTLIISPGGEITYTHTGYIDKEELLNEMERAPEARRVIDDKLPFPPIVAFLGPIILMILRLVHNKRRKVIG
jgi:hypothetical protein